MSQFQNNVNSDNTNSFPEQNMEDSTVNSEQSNNDWNYTTTRPVCPPSPTLMNNSFISANQTQAQIDYLEGFHPTGTHMELDEFLLNGFSEDLTHFNVNEIPRSIVLPPVAKAEEAAETAIIDGSKVIPDDFIQPFLNQRVHSTGTTSTKCLDTIDSFVTEVPVTYKPQPVAETSSGFYTMPKFKTPAVNHALKDKEVPFFLQAPKRAFKPISKPVPRNLAPKKEKSVVVPVKEKPVIVLPRVQKDIKRPGVLDFTKENQDIINKYWKLIETSESIKRATHACKSNMKKQKIKPIKFDLIKNNVIPALLPNALRVENFEDFQGVNGYHYERNINSFNLDGFTRWCTYSPNFYQPVVIRGKQDKNKKLREIEGLCPYCPIDVENIDDSFHSLGSALYQHHLCKNHGVYTSGNEMPVPAFGVKNDKVVAVCPKCPTVIQLQVHNDSFKSSMTPYFRHCFDTHNISKACLKQMKEEAYKIAMQKKNQN